jgi:hypothetical protein
MLNDFMLGVVTLNAMAPTMQPGKVSESFSFCLRQKIKSRR